MIFILIFLIIIIIFNYLITHAFAAKCKCLETENYIINLSVILSLLVR